MALIYVKVEPWHVPRLVGRKRGTTPEFGAECSCGWKLRVRYGDRGSAEHQMMSHMETYAHEPEHPGRFEYRLAGGGICGTCLGKGVVVRNSKVQSCSTCEPF